MPLASLLRFEVEDPVHGQVPCAALLHPEHARRALPSCLMLYGGGGSRETLAALQPVFEQAWSEGTLAPCVLATPDCGPWSFYLDDSARGLAWESFIVQRFVQRVQALQPTAASQRLGVIGMSMGGYGALKLAFARPQLFAAVAAVSPMIEPYSAGRCRCAIASSIPPRCQRRCSVRPATPSCTVLITRRHAHAPTRPSWSSTAWRSTSTPRAEMP